MRSSAYTKDSSKSEKTLYFVDKINTAGKKGFL